MNKRIFISHAVKDKIISDLFIDVILQNGLGLVMSEIYCTSNEGTKITPGEDWRNSIRQAIINSKINFLLITPNYNKSEVCLNEMGAAWVSNAKVIPLIVDPITYSTSGVIQEVNQIEKLLDEYSLDRIKDVIQAELQIESSQLISDRWTAKKKEFLERVNHYLETNPFEHLDTDLVVNLSNRIGSDFVSGLNISKVYSKEEAENGSVYHYSNGRKFKIDFMHYQTSVMFFVTNENNQKQRLDFSFEVGYNDLEEEIQHLKEKTRFLVGQYDFDADGIDELVIAIQDYDEFDNGLCINIFKLQRDSWELIGLLTGKDILGEPKAVVKINKVTIPRNLRGFYYQWVFEGNKFVETSDL